MIINLPDPNMYPTWQEWARQLTQELQGMLDGIPFIQGQDGVFTTVDGKTITVQHGIVVKVES